MSSLKNSLKPKKILKNLALKTLTVGASLILGFLSFGGMYALIPFLPFAYAAFALSVLYEGEIYLKNITGAFGKLFKSNYLENQLAKEYLLAKFPRKMEHNTPQFFKDYKAQLKLLATYGHERLDPASKKSKKQIEKTLSDMEKWFALQLFPRESTNDTLQSEYIQELQEWLQDNEQEQWQTQLDDRRFTFQWVKIFSMLSALFMGLGSTYLIVEAFTVIPVIAAIPFVFWPVMIVPMAIVAGAAYGMLTYNSVTDLINNNTVLKWYHKLSKDLGEGLSFRNLFMATTAVLLVGLALALTICTAGTWWTIATSARPLFAWMKQMPYFILGVLNPVITGLSAIFFNIQNTAESLDMIDEAMRGKNVLQRVYEWVTEGYKHLLATENWLQIINPFRLLIKLTVVPLRVIFFAGHLLSIAVTANRMPGLSQIASALIALISEGFEDAHYFINEEPDEHHGHTHSIDQLLKERLDEASGHTHEVDIPSWLLKNALSPVYFLAAVWEVGARKLIDAADANQVISAESQSFTQLFASAWEKHWGNGVKQSITLAADARRPSSAWQQEHIMSQIEKHTHKQLQSVTFGHDLAEEKINELQQLKQHVRTLAPEETLAALESEQGKAIYGRHRLFSLTKTATSTEEFLEALPRRVNLR